MFEPLLVVALGEVGAVLGAAALLALERGAAAAVTSRWRVGTDEPLDTAAS